MEKGLKTLSTLGKTANRRERYSKNSSDPNEEITDSRDCASRRSQSHHSNSPNDFDDSGLGHSFGHKNDPQSAPYSAGGLSASSPSFPSPHRTYSSASSTGYTPTIAAAPYLQQSPVQPQAHSLPPFQQPTLPSFSSAFGMPSISSVINPPHHHRGSAVTTHC